LETERGDAATATHDGGRKERAGREAREHQSGGVIIYHLLALWNNDDFSESLEITA
jgi:hypothetical protein